MIVVGSPAIVTEVKKLFYARVSGAEQLPLGPDRFFTPDGVTVVWVWLGSRWTLNMINVVGPRIDTRGNPCGHASMVVNDNDGPEYDWARDFAQGVRPFDTPL